MQGKRIYRIVDYTNVRRKRQSGAAYGHEGRKKVEGVTNRAGVKRKKASTVKKEAHTKSAKTRKEGGQAGWQGVLS